MIKDDLRALASFRLLVANGKTALEAARDRLNKTPEAKTVDEIVASLAEYQAKASEIESTIKTSWAMTAVDQFANKTGEEKEKAITEFRSALAKGLGLRITHSLKYDEAAAIKWCEVNAKAAIKTVLDKKPFEALAETSNIEFIEKIDTPSITIATDLSEYLLE